MADGTAFSTSASIEALVDPMCQPYQMADEQSTVFPTSASIEALLDPMCQRLQVLSGEADPAQSSASETADLSPPTYGQGRWQPYAQLSVTLRQSVQGASDQRRCLPL